MAWQIGVDVGGTFTDLLALDPERGVFRVAKVPSTPEDQSVGFIHIPSGPPIGLTASGVTSGTSQSQCSRLTMTTSGAIPEDRCRESSAGYRSVR
jgi:N-methylhydantoinase A/oxoprolinase/acetone carboxylase beta subunit